MNADGSLPVARWKEMWQALFGAGDVGRAWCHHRFARIRNFMSDQGWLSWQEENFIVGVYGENGRYVPGRASKWKASEELMAKLGGVNEQEGSVIGDIVGVVNSKVEEKEEGGSILYGHNLLNQDTDHPVSNQDNHIRSVKTVKSPDPTPNPRQSTSLQDVLEAYGIWTPLPRPRFAGYSTGKYRMAA